MEYEHNEGRPPSMQDVTAIMSALRPPKNANPPILGIRLQNMMREQQNGYPKHLYHDALDPVFALNEDQEAELQKLGYVEHYIRRTHPKTLFRRNFDKKFALQRDLATGEPVNIEFVETRILKSAHAEAELRKQKPALGCGPWVEKLDQIEPIPEGPGEDPAVTIGRLQGQLDEARRAAEKKQGKGA